jgi:hypothetical protein
MDLGPRDQKLVDLEKKVASGWAICCWSNWFGTQSADKQYCHFCGPLIWTQSTQIRHRTAIHQAQQCPGF